MLANIPLTDEEQAAVDEDPSPATDSRVGHASLSNLAVSPFGLPLAPHAKEVRVAWVGRTSTEEHQDPRHFYDVESGRMELERRGHGSDYERFAIPIARDGGIADLRAEAQRPARRFDVVICESMSRIARKMYENLSVERELERAEVPVFASNEPILLTGGRAQQILQRRINQSVAEPRPVSSADLGVLDLLPHLAVNLDRAPEDLQRRLYELTKLSVEIHYHTNEATLVITLPREDLTMISTAATALHQPGGPPHHI